MNIVSVLDETVEEWFSHNKISCLNIITVCLILNKKDIDRTYSAILNKLHNDGKINIDQVHELKIRYKLNRDSGLIQNFINIIKQIGDNPNLIYPNKWTLHTPKTKIRNKCFPCRSMDQ